MFDLYGGAAATDYNQNNRNWAWFDIEAAAMTVIPTISFPDRHPLNGAKGRGCLSWGFIVRTTVDPNNMLLCPTAKNDQILMRGTVNTPGSSGGATVFFPATLPSPPFVFYWMSPFSTADYYPFAPDPSMWQYGETTSCFVYLDRMTFISNLGGRVVK